MQVSNLNTYNKPNFKGYDARPLKGLFVLDKNCFGATEQLKRLTEKTGLQIFTPNIASKSILKEYIEEAKKSHLMWGQDYITNIRSKFVLFEMNRDFLKRILRSVTDGMKRDLKLEPVNVNMEHIRGGNFFICNNKGKEELLIHEGKVLYPPELLKRIYNVENVHVIPQLDYHLDLFIRPLSDGRVLVADDKLTMHGLNEGIEKINKYLNVNIISESERNILTKIADDLKNEINCYELTVKHSQYNPVANTDKVVMALKDAGYEPIRIPGNCYRLNGFKDPKKEKEMMDNFERTMAEVKKLSKDYSAEEQQQVETYIELQRIKAASNKTLGVELVNLYENNFVNAIVTVKDGKIVYITNEALLDKRIGITPEIEKKIGFSTKKLFTDSIKPYVDEENIHFISEKTTGELFKNYGGIHCVGAEITI